MDIPSKNPGDESRHPVLISGALQLFIGVSSHAFRTSSGRAARLGKLLLHYRLFWMNLLVEKLGRELAAIVNFYLLETAAYHMHH